MYHAGSWLGSIDTFRPRSLSSFIVWEMVISALLDLASLPKAESRPLSLLLPSALTLLSDIVRLPWDTDMASSGGQNEFSGFLEQLNAPRGYETRTPAEKKKK